MLSYRHAFHAGNFADVFKHTLLALLVSSLHKKDKPFFVLDTHAGQGMYDLNDPRAQGNKEWEGGIQKVWNRTDTPAAVSRYLDLVQRTNSDGRLRYYPGSPEIIRALLRSHDRLVLTDLQQDEIAALHAHFGADARVHIHRRDGYEGLKAFLPPPEKRGLVLIDPAYELKTERSSVVKGLVAATERWPTGTYAIWYPIQLAADNDKFLTSLKNTSIKKMFVAELSILPDDIDSRLNGTGMVIVNPPWQLDAALKETLPWLHQALAQEGEGAWRMEWLARE